MTRDGISENVKRRLYAESMGRCMNPACQKELFIGEGDIIEKAHIIPYCKEADNSYENLIVLCPNCHTMYDKLSGFNTEEIKQWKQIRIKELERVFSKAFSNFDEMKSIVVPLLHENKYIYENYYMENKKELWELFEGKILANNKKIRMLCKTF